MDIKTLHCKSVKICGYCNNLREVKYFRLMKNKYCKNCKDCNKEINKKLRFSMVEHNCEICDRILITPKRLLKLCIKQHIESQSHQKSLRQNSGLG